MNKTVKARVEYRFTSATAEEVFDAWLSQEDVRVWMTHSLKANGLSGEIGSVEIDARLGGGFLFTDTRDGEEARHWGTYEVFERPRVLQFTWFTSEEEEKETTSVVRIEITPEKTGCSVVLTHEMDAEWAAYKEQAQNSWRYMLAAIEKTKTGA